MTTRAELLIAHQHFRTIEVPRVLQGPWIDGDLRDEVWRQALEVNEFLDITGYLEHRHHCNFNSPRQFVPEPAPVAAEPTTRAFCCHDGEYLYIGFCCEDPADLSQLRCRDHGFGCDVEQEDCVYVWLDPSLTHLSPYTCEYVVNAAGQKTERLRGQTAGDYSSLMAWEGRVKVGDTGWAAEIMLPLARLGLSANEMNVFGLNLGRGYRGQWRTHAWLPFDGDFRPGWGVALLLDQKGGNRPASQRRIDAALRQIERISSGCALPTEPAGLYRQPDSTQDESAMIGVSLWGPDHQPTISVGRSDSYDRRWYGNDFPVVTRHEVIEAGMSGDPRQLDALRQQTSGRQYNAYPHFPGPKPVGQVILFLPGGEEGGWKTDVIAGEDGARELHCVSLQGELRLRIYVHKRRNLVVVEGTQRGLEGEKLALRLYRHNDSPVVRKIEGYDYDADVKAGQNVSPLPPPTVGVEPDIVWLRQEYYAEKTFPDGFEVLLAGAVSGVELVATRAHINEIGLGTAASSPYEGWSGPLGNEGWRATDWERMNALPGSAVTVRVKLTHDRFRVFAPVLSTNDGHDLHAVARRLIDEAESLAPEELEADSRNATVAERVGNYCFKQDLALASIFSSKFCASDKVAWHGDFHFNEWAGYFPFHDYFILGHTAPLETYFQMVESNLPAARALARDAFGCRGAAWGVTSFPLLLDRLPMTALDWDYSMENTGFVVQPFWLTYLYTMDPTMLQRAHALLQEASLFYADYVTKEKDGLYHIWPCVSSEHVPLQPHLKYNRDSIAVLAMVKFTLQAYCEASATLDTNDALINSCRDIVEHLAPYPTEDTPDGPRFVDVAGARLMTEYNIAAPLFPVFYGNDIGLASPQEEVDKAKRSLAGINRISTGGGHYLHVYRAMTRLGIYHGGEIGCENLIQSHQGPVFLFPAVPEDYTGEFHDYHARGGFVFSARMEAGRLRFVSIKSLAGCRCVLGMSRFEHVPTVKRLTEHAAVDVSVESGRTMSFATECGASYGIEP